jgi:hypothetical protein
LYELVSLQDIKLNEVESAAVLEGVEAELRVEVGEGAFAHGWWEERVVSVEDGQSEDDDAHVDCRDAAH